jgi:DNA helicase-2/ATP-dependent DNA helicase PcrA
LEEFFRRSKEAEAILPKTKLIQSLKDILDGKAFSEKEEKKFKERGEELLSEYYEAYADTWTHKVDLEKYIKRDFEVENGENITISGMIDKIEYLDDLFGGRINIVDYKTGRSFSEKTKDEKKDYERQIVFYHLLLDGYDENVTINQSMLDFIEKNKKGVFEQHSFPVTKEKLDELKGEINTCVREVLSLEFLKKGCGKKDCEWCGLSR